MRHSSDKIAKCNDRYNARLLHTHSRTRKLNLNLNFNSDLHAEFGLEQLRARGISRLKVLEKKFVRVPTGGHKFITPVQGR